MINLSTAISTVLIAIGVVVVIQFIQEEKRKDIEAKFDKMMDTALGDSEQKPFDFDGNDGGQQLNPHGHGGFEQMLREQIAAQLNLDPSQVDLSDVMNAEEANAIPFTVRDAQLAIKDALNSTNEAMRSDVLRVHDSIIREVQATVREAEEHMERTAMSSKKVRIIIEAHLLQLGAMIRDNVQGMGIAMKYVKTSFMHFLSKIQRRVEEGKAKGLIEKDVKFVRDILQDGLHSSKADVDAWIDEVKSHLSAMTKEVAEGVQRLEKAVNGSSGALKNSKAIAKAMHKISDSVDTSVQLAIQNFADWAEDGVRIFCSR